MQRRYQNLSSSRPISGPVMPSTYSNVSRVSVLLNPRKSANDRSSFEAPDSATNKIQVQKLRTTIYINCTSTSRRQQDCTEIVSGYCHTNPGCVLLVLTQMTIFAWQIVNGGVVSLESNVAIGPSPTKFHDTIYILHVTTSQTSEHVHI